MNCVDLFSGTGAFSKVAEKYGMNVVFANDYEPNSKKIYDLNFNHKLTLGDINEIDLKDIPKMDLLTGGFPCQPFSISGEKKGFEDVRSNVFFKIMEIIKEYKPRFVILENVKNLTSHDKGNTFMTIQSQIEYLDYKIKYKILDTKKITNIPQNRERIYIVCFRDDSDYNKFSFPEETKEMKQIKDILEEKVDDKYYYSDRYKVWDKVKAAVVKENTVYQYRRHYIRENKNNVCPTLTANMGTGGHNVPLIKDKKGIRKLTPRECARLQGLPDTYKFPEKMSDNKLYKLMGNAVTVNVVDKLFEQLIKLL